MKKLKKQDFKKVAWKGVAAGIMLASQASAQQFADVNSYANMLAAGCGSSCSTAYRNMPSSGCGGKQSAGCGGRQTAYNPPANSCSSTSMAPSAPPATARPASEAYYTDPATGQWRKGQPPAEWTTNQPANPNQDQKVDTQYGQPQQQRQQQYQNSQYTSYADSTDTSAAGQDTEQTLSGKLNPQTRALFERIEFRRQSSGSQIG